MLSALCETTSELLWEVQLEAEPLTSIGAAYGFVLGILVALGINTAFPAIPASTPLSAVLAALATSAFTGILFGLLPAARAPRLDPVEALRHE